MNITHLLIKLGCGLMSDFPSRFYHNFQDLELAQTVIVAISLVPSLHCQLFFNMQKMLAVETGNEASSYSD